MTVVLLTLRVRSNRRNLTRSVRSTIESPYSFADPNRDGVPRDIGAYDSRNPRGRPPCGRHLLRWAASLKLTFLLLVILTGVVAYAWFLESAKGRESAEWYVYRREWFIGLLGVLAANIAAAGLARFPRHWSQAGRAILSIGLLVLLAGFIRTLVWGIEGRLILKKGVPTQTLSRIDRSQLTLLVRSGQKARPTAELGFSPGPVDWPNDQPLDFGEVDGMGVKVLQFYRHARFHVDGVADETGLAPPAIQVALPVAQGGRPVEPWCVPRPFSLPSITGKLNVWLEQTSVPSFRDEFLQPPPLKPGSRGILSVHYKDHICPIPVDGSTGKKFPVGDSGLTVEIVDDQTKTQSPKAAKSNSAETQPENPAVRLRVHVPDQKEPISVVAYARFPFVSHGAMNKQTCPAKFWYHHPAVKAAAGVEFLQSPDGKLYCRVSDGNAYQPRGEVKEGDRIALSADRQVSLLRYIPHARLEGTFSPVEVAPGETTEAEAAAQVELTTGDHSERFSAGTKRHAGGELRRRRDL